MTIRDCKKAVSGPQPRYRALLGAVALMATKKMTYREAEDLIAQSHTSFKLLPFMSANAIALKKKYFSKYRQSEIRRFHNEDQSQPNLLPLSFRTISNSLIES
jgi:hypothetical protein